MRTRLADAWGKELLGAAQARANASRPFAPEIHLEQNLGPVSPSAPGTLPGEKHERFQSVDAETFPGGSAEECTLD